ncbi:MAG: chromosome segregation SMC family protein [Pelagibacteraceae bacterium]|jgi:chromosome segregation protein|nr:chromosome segregation protein SMC [Candidatus Pelagibacter sp.]MDP6681237.1 chromosome segregation SMC family protein [Pelagibacteraceae bacterium]MDP6710702.1 chromosome segregation SMC family protein [Pelagibacteraceae bacterium]
MEFKKLELIGFKSFVDKTSFAIEKGLTGIVGPNGCGKSNIVEAIRWCMGETSAKSMRGTGMEDVIFSGTANRTSKNIAEVSLTLGNSDKSGPIQFKELDIINIKRRIQKEKGSRYFINGKEMRARDVQTFFADLSTGAHSPSMISQGKIGVLVTAKLTDRRAILEEAAGISGIHARRHESELRLNSAENNLKRANDLKKQQEKQLENLKKQAQEASKYKLISEEIKKIEAGLFYLKMTEIEKEINVSKEIASESDDEISGLTIEINHNNNLLKEENIKLKPLRDENIEILSKLQRLNLEFQNLEEEEKRAKSEKDRLLKSENTMRTDIEREKNIVSDAQSNEKRLNEEKNSLFNTEKKYYDLEKQTQSDLQIATEKLKDEQDELEKISKKLSQNNLNKEFKNFLININENLESAKVYLENNENNKALYKINNIIHSVRDEKERIETEIKQDSSDDITKLTNKIKLAQEKYASTLSKHQSIQTETIRRQERIKNIDIEIQNWKNLKFNSEKMIEELIGRDKKIKSELENIIKLPETTAIKKGQLMQNTSTTENEKQNLSKQLAQAEIKNQETNRQLKLVEEKMMLARESKARSGATLEGLENRKKDLIGRIESELDINEKDLLINSDLKDLKTLPNAIEQEDKLDAKKNERERLGSVNLRADEETEQYKTSINKMEKDREDLILAITKLRSSINELNQKGRERLLEAFDKVNRKFNEVYTKLFNGGNAKLEFVDAEDPLEAGLEMLVSPPGKRLQSITLLSGGEQALTALSLIFAVFLTSPAPICILDEVDAPLDDANVTRFCSLLDELTKITETKFIIITHHALTMSRMERLYGVTMPEKGISQLVSVDLERAEELVA